MYKAWIELCFTVNTDIYNVSVYLCQRSLNHKIEIWHWKCAITFTSDPSDFLHMKPTELFTYRKKTIKTKKVKSKTVAWGDYFQLCHVSSSTSCVSLVSLGIKWSQTSQVGKQKHAVCCLLSGFFAYSSSIYLNEHSRHHSEPENLPIASPNCPLKKAKIWYGVFKFVCFILSGETVGLQAQVAEPPLHISLCFLFKFPILSSIKTNAQSN